MNYFYMIFRANKFWKVLIIIACVVLLVLVDFFYFYESIYSKGLSDKEAFETIYINFILLVFIFLPWLTEKVESISDSVVLDFLDLPAKGRPIRFTDISTFLSDQALGAFLAGILIFTGHIVASEYGAIMTAIYTLIIYIFSIGLVSISLLRFMYHFIKYNGFIYGLATLISFSIMFTFYFLGLKMAA